MNDTPSTTPPPPGGDRPTWIPNPENPYAAAGSPDQTAAFASTPAGSPSGPPAGPPTGPPASPFGQPFEQSYGAPLGPPVGPAAATPKRRGRRTFAASVIAASLLVGGGAGIGGAAAWSALNDDSSAGSGAGTTSARTTSQVVDSPTPAAAAADGSVESVAAAVLPSVVKINVTGSQESGSGSGIILSSDGEILTNNHVVAVAGDGGSISVSFNDGTTATATVLGTDPLTDTALIKADGVSGLTPATIGKSSDLQVGQSVVAIGSPFGLESTVTSGIVSALNRPVDVGSDADGNATVYPAVQTDAAINPGNSGGALVDLAGHVVGINASIQTTSDSQTSQGGSIGLGFAIPIDEVMPIAAQMEAGETPTHARLGIKVSDVGATTQGGAQQAPSEGAEVAPGAQVQEVGDGSTAATAGLAVGDVITKVDDQLISSSNSLVATVRSYRPGDTVTVTYTQGGETKTAQLKLDSDADASNS